ncbi:hypothetical protein Tco_0818334, partial [Tanacetum coccineum]
LGDERLCSRGTKLNSIFITAEDDVEAYVKTCLVCQQDKGVHKHPVGLLKPLPTPERPWESVSTDWPYPNQKVTEPLWWFHAKIATQPIQINALYVQRLDKKARRTVRDSKTSRQVCLSTWFAFTIKDPPGRTCDLLKEYDEDKEDERRNVSKRAIRM